MELDYIREFVTLAESENYLQASESLFIAQSTLSKHIKNIETELGVTLFDRTTRKVSLNSYGKSFLPYARKLLDLQDEYMTVLAGQLRSTSSSLTIASIPVMTHYHINEILSSFQKAMPNFKLEIIESDTTEMLEMLKNGKCDFAFLRETAESGHEFPTITFDSDHIVAVLPRNHALAREPFVTLAQLKDENFFFLSKQTMMHALCSSACQKAGFTPNVTFTSHRAANIIDLVSKGMGVALLTKKPAAAFLNPDTVLVDVVPYVTTKICLAYPGAQKLPPASRTFLNFVKKQMEEQNRAPS